MQTNKNHQQSTFIICPVCQNSYNTLYSIASCQHKFCQQCCITYIKTKADNFSQSKCLQQGCEKPLNKQKIIYSKLSKQIQDKISKYQAFDFFQKNSQFKACSLQSCKGYFNKNNPEKICNQCGLIHCSKCFNNIHEGQCDKSHQRSLQRLNYKKCPNCQIWVQKTQGCQYIQCKCGTSFCYRCGNFFQRDPCRKKQLWKRELQIKKTLKNIKLRKPATPEQVLLFVPLLLLKIITTLLVTIFFCWALLFLVLLIIPLIFIFSPLLMIMAIQQTQGCVRYFCIFLFIIFYPLLSFLFGTIFIVAILLYPCMRHVYHHGVYDPMDEGLTKLVLCYLQFMQNLWQL